MYILKGIFVYMIKEQCSNKGERTWTAQNSCNKNIIDYNGKVISAILLIRPLQNECQWSVHNAWLGIMVTLHDNWSRRFINDVQAALMGKSQGDTLAVWFWNTALTDHQQFWVL